MTSAPNITVLFRYRDLIAETIPSHQAVIDKCGACWWGWWKRPTEDERAEIWDHLEQRLAGENGRVPVGLFDSGATTEDKMIHVAWVTALKPPVYGSPRAIPTVFLTEAELLLVPEYYRKSVFSRAWLRLDKIESNAIALLPAKFSYNTAPPLPGIDKADLERLEGKTVVDRDELRAMDTTIWNVRPWRSTDPQDRFLSSSLRVAHAVSAEPIRVRGGKILHLSDLHFGDGEHRKRHHWGYPGDGSNKPTLSEAVSSALTQHGKSDIAVLVITGDFTFIASQKEFDHARHQIAALMGPLDLGQNDIVMIPGNHDIRWTREDTYKPEAEVTVAPEEATEQYRLFYKSLLRHEAGPHLCMGRRFVFDNGSVVDICALNSSALAQGKNFLSGMGQVPSGEFKRIAKELGWTEPGASLRILAMHHHLVPVEDVERPEEFDRGFGMANDAQRTLRQAATHNVGLVLHGHRHRAFVWRSNVYHLPDEVQQRWEIGGVNLLGSGSTGSSDVRAESNFFNVLTPQADHLELEMYRATKCGEFEFMKRWRAALTLDPTRGLVPLAWETA